VTFWVTPPPPPVRTHKEFQVAVRSDSPTFRGETVQATSLVPPETMGGLRFPMRFPLRFGGQGSTTSGYAVNEGDAPSWPVLRIYGRTVNPVIANLSSGEAIHIEATVAAGEYLEIDSRLRRVSLNGVQNASRYYVVRRDLTTWWPVYPGSNALRMTDLEHNATARTDVVWTNAYL
jgi:hypothetical protein